MGTPKTRGMLARTVLGSSRVARYAMGPCNVRTIHSRGQFGARSPALGPTIYQAVCRQPTSLPGCLAAARVSFCTAVSETDRLREEVKLAMLQDSNFFLALIQEFGNAKQPEEAEAVLELMQQAGVAPDNHNFTSLIRACSAAKQPERAAAVLELMQQAGVAPDNSTFRILISSWVPAKQPERAEAVLDLMQQAGVAPDSSTFTSLIDSWAAAKQPERAEAVLELMQQAGVAPDSSTFCLTDQLMESSQAARA